MTAERLDAARRLRTNGQSYRKIGEALDVGASTVRENLTRGGEAGAGVEWLWTHWAVV